jgi:wyosine [tRNA(Phe)-imidazoG37] synthetase (radical SAM superfamily)
MVYQSCQHLEDISMYFLGHVDGNCMTFCCVPGFYPPKMPMTDDPEETINNFFKLRTEIILESIKLSMQYGNDIPEDAREMTKSCYKCPFFVAMDKTPGGVSFIKRVTFGVYPSICQIRCIYCRRGEDGDDYEPFDERLHKEGYDKVFATIEYAHQNDMIAPDALWDISCGEITVHPYRKRLYELTKGKATMFYTNCCIYDKDIADNLAANPHSAISFSIDAGTSTTWRKVKGVDNFNVVKSNLVKYHGSIAHSKQIVLKYIVLPGLNDTVEDYKGIVEIMKLLGLDALTISRETYGVTPESRPDDPESNLTYNERVIGATAYLFAVLHKNGLRCGHIWGFSSEDSQQAVEFAHVLLAEGKV